MVDIIVNILFYYIINIPYCFHDTLILSSNQLSYTMMALSDHELV